MAAEPKPSRKKAAGTTRRRKKVESAPPRGLKATELTQAAAPTEMQPLLAAIEADGGTVLGVFRDPLGGHWQILAGLPLDRVDPTPFQRDLSAAHVTRLAKAIDELDRFLDPVIAVRTEDGRYWTPNGHHRTAALRQLGGRSLVALVVPDARLAYRILALNTEKAHNLRERALEVARMAQSLAELDPRPEREFAAEFEEAALVTLGLCYQEKGRFAGSAYHPVLKRVDAFLAARLPAALATRRERAVRLLELEEAVNAAIAGLKEKGFDSPYLKAFVVARINPLRFQRGAKTDFDETIARMLDAARRFDPSKIRPDQIARAPGPPAE